MHKSSSRFLPRFSTGFTLTETLIVGALFGVAIIVSTLMLSTERARTRDAIRMADMTRVASGFALLFSQQASYASAASGCAAVGAEVRTCALTTPIGTISDVRDPGRYTYSISRVPDRNDFGVTFQLERRYGQIAAGRHILSKNGIQ